jgi:hypothetical protein
MKGGSNTILYSNRNQPTMCSDRSGVSNREIGELAGVNDQGQISKLMLSRLEGQGLVENTGGNGIGRVENVR